MTDVATLRGTRADSKRDTIVSRKSCGTAMASVAAAMREKGFSVTGSDQNVYPPMSTFLAERKIEVIAGIAEHNLAHRPDLVVLYVVDQLRVLADEKQQELALRAPVAIYTVGDAALLRQALMRDLAMRLVFLMQIRWPNRLS